MLPTENPWPAMIILATAAAVCLIQGAARRKFVPLILGIAFGLLAAGCFVLDGYVVTPRELITQHVYDLTSAFQKGDEPGTLAFFSPKAPEREIISDWLPDKLKVGDDLRVTDVSVTFKAADSLAISHFRANASVTANVFGFVGTATYQPSRWELDWQREAGEWKIIKVHRLHPMTGREIRFLSAE